MNVGSFNVGMTLFVTLLFVLLTPGVVVSFPQKGSILNKAILHGFLFAVIYHYVHKSVWKMVGGKVHGSASASGSSMKKEGFNANNKKMLEKFKQQPAKKAGGM